MTQTYSDPSREIRAAVAVAKLQAAHNAMDEDVLTEMTTDAYDHYVSRVVSGADPADAYADAVKKYPTPIR